MANILVIEDEKAINQLIQKNLQLVGHTCYSMYDGVNAECIVKEKSIDLVLLDIMLPQMDGFQVFETIRSVPVIFLTAKGNLQDKLKGLTLGADDYIVKPFEMLELIARVEAVLRRVHKNNRILEFGHVSIDFGSRQIYMNGQAVECTPQEYQLFEVLVTNRNLAMSREKLLELAWGYDFDGDSRTVDVHIQKLRKKLGMEDNIKTVYKLGYRLEV